MSNIAPIETWYKGVKYPSKCEARWAIFLEAIQEKTLLVNDFVYTYQPTPLFFPELGKYTPDYFIVAENVEFYLEIKPKMVISSVIDRLLHFSYLSGTNILLAIGDFYKEHKPKLYVPIKGEMQTKRFVKFFSEIAEIQEDEVREAITTSSQYRLDLLTLETSPTYDVETSPTYDIERGLYTEDVLQLIEKLRRAGIHEETIQRLLFE